VTPALILTIAIAIVLAVLSFLALKYPRGREDWGRDRAETGSILATTLTFVLLFMLLWYASATVDWPAAATIAFWSAVCTLIVLIIVSLVFPGGLDLKRDGE
jgi:peptidoglycan biosynthesis protein MviN/MurJ (putative lipid II flippase)